MEQRPLRLGDILDDYCPRERRVTNHAVVAMVEDTVKQTRCTTCDSEHAYKGGKAPRRRGKKDGPSALYKEVLAGKPDTDVPSPIDAADLIAQIDSAGEVEAVDAGDAGDVADVDTQEDVTTDVDVPAPMLADSSEERAPEPEEGPVHRQLIRATLPRIEGQKEERRPTDFTIRQSPGRGGNPQGNFRGGNDRNRPGGRGQGNSGNAGHGGNNAHRGNGHRPHGGPRFAGSRSGQGQGQGHGRGQGGGFRSAQQPRHGGGGRKRSR